MYTVRTDKVVDTTYVRDEFNQMCDKCDMLHMLKVLRDRVWQSHRLKDEQKLHYICEVAPVIKDLMADVKQDTEQCQQKLSQKELELQG